MPTDTGSFMTLGDVINQYPTSIITVCIAFSFLWLSLYIFRVDPDDDLSKLASAALFTIFLYLFGSFLVGTAVLKTQVLLYQRTLWWLPFAPVLWLHLSQKATPPLQFRGKARYLLGTVINYTRISAVRGAFYGVAALFFLTGVFTDSIIDFGAIQDFNLPIKNRNLPIGSAYPLFAIFMFVTSSIAWVNFLSAWWKESKNADTERFIWHGIKELSCTVIPFYKCSSRSQFWWLSFGGILFWLASTGLLARSVTNIRTDYMQGETILGLGMLIVAIAILKHNALINKEALEKDAIYTSIGALGVAVVYGIADLIGQGKVSDVPISLLALVTMLALFTHMLADTLKIWLSKLVGTRLGLFSEGDIDKMKQLYREASRVKRQPGPTIELFDDDNKTVDRLLGMLTPRQREIITLRAKGLSDKEIAVALDIKLPTVRKHVEDIKNRIGSRDKADCAIYCVVTGLLSKDDLLDWFDSLQITGDDA